MSIDDLIAVIDTPGTDTDTLKGIARTHRIGVRKALLDSDRCPLVSRVAEDRLAYEGVDIGIFVDQHSRRAVCRAIIGTGHRAEAALLFADPTFRILDSLRTLQSLFTIHGGKKRDRKLNRHDYLRFLADFNARGGQQGVLDLPFITMLTGIRLLGQEGLVRVMTHGEVPRVTRTLRLLEAVVGGTGGEESAHQQKLLARWIAARPDDAWVPMLHDYLERKYQRRVQKRRNRPPRSLHQSRFAEATRQFNKVVAARGVRVHLPRSERELQALGATMAHCIGSEHNVEDAVHGRHVILHAHPIGARRRGVTCQFRSDGQFLQGRGFANAEADPALVALARELAETLLTHDAPADSRATSTQLRR